MERLIKATSELAKALTAAGASGTALQPEDLEPALVEELLRLQPLLQVMPIKQAKGRVHEIVRRTAHGAAAFEGELVDNRAGAVQSTYDRPTVTLKPLHYWGAVTGFQRAASQRFIDSLVAEQKAGVEAMSNQAEFAILWGATADPYIPDGLDQIIVTNIVDHNAVVTLKLLDDLIDGATGFRGADKDPALFVASKGMVSKISGLQTLARREVQTVEYEGGFRMTLYRGYPILETDYVKPSAQAPGTLAAAIATGGALPNGVYRYQVAAVYENGEQRAAAECNCTSGATEHIANLTWVADPLALLYKIYRSDVDGGAGTAYLYTTIAGKTRDGDGKITGNVAAWSDTANLTRPGGAASKRYQATGEENIFFVNLNPEDRGASVVSLIDPIGQAVDNLVTFIELGRTRASYDFLLESLMAVQVPWERLHAHARRVKIA
jgi:hypothetical protein